MNRQIKELVVDTGSAVENLNRFDILNNDKILGVRRDHKFLFFYSFISFSLFITVQIKSV